LGGDSWKTSGTLVSFSLGGNIPDMTPTLATVDAGSGKLLLNMGPRAGFRRYGNTTDGNESFAVSYLPADVANTDPNDDHDHILVSALGGVQAFDASRVTSIYAEGGSGNDSVTIAKEVLVPVEVYGDFANGTGGGKDVLKAGGGPATLRGGARRR